MPHHACIASTACRTVPCMQACTHVCMRGMAQHTSDSTAPCSGTHTFAQGVSRSQYTGSGTLLGVPLLFTSRTMKQADCPGQVRLSAVESLEWPFCFPSSDHLHILRVSRNVQISVWFLAVRNMACLSHQWLVANSVLAFCAHSVVRGGLEDGVGGELQYRQGGQGALKVQNNQIRDFSLAVPALCSNGTPGMHRNATARGSRRVYGHANGLVCRCPKRFGANRRRHSRASPSLSKACRQSPHGPC